MAWILNRKVISNTLNIHQDKMLQVPHISKRRRRSYLKKVRRTAYLLIFKHLPNGKWITLGQLPRRMKKEVTYLFGIQIITMKAHTYLHIGVLNLAGTGSNSRCKEQ